MAETVTKTVLDIDKLFSQIVVNSETHTSSRYVEPKKTVVSTNKTSSSSSSPKKTNRNTTATVGQDVYAVELNNILHNFVDRAVTQNLQAEVTARQNADTVLREDITNLSTSVTAINSKIPSQASAQNQLADKNFVNSSVATNTANFLGTYTSLQQIEAIQNPTNNDYAFLQTEDSAGNTEYQRYKYSSATSQWEYEYTLNNSSFTAEQWATINSGLTQSAVVDLIGQNNSASADKLKTARNLKVNLASTTAQSFDGTANAESIGVSGTLPEANGGTGATTARGAEYNIIGSVEQVDYTFDDNRYIAVQNQTVSASNGTFRWFKMSNLWTYIKDKISSVLGLTASQYGGNSATASTLTQWGSINTNSDKAVEGMVIYNYLVNTLNIKPLSESSASKFAVLPVSLTANSTYRLSYLLLCDITALNGVSSGGSSYGFVGKMYAHRLGGYLREHCSDWILTASYNESDSQGDSLRLLTTDTFFTPVKIKNESTGKTYLAIKYDYGRETNITLAGTFANITSTPSIVNLKLNTDLQLVDSSNNRWTVKCTGYTNMLNIDNAGTRNANAPTATTANTAKSLGTGTLVNKLTSTVPSGYIDVTGKSAVELASWKESYYAGMFYKSKSGDSFYYYNSKIYFNDTATTGISSSNPVGKMVERQGAYYLLTNDYLYKSTTGTSFTRVFNYSDIKDIMISSNGTFYVLRSWYGLYTLSTSDSLTQVVSNSSSEQNCLFETSDGTILVGGEKLWKVNGSSYQAVYSPTYSVVAIGENKGYLYIQTKTLDYIYYGTLSGTFTRLNHNLDEGVSFVHQKFGNGFYIIGKSSSNNTTALVYEVTDTTPTLTQVNSFAVQTSSSYYYQIYQDDEGLIYVNNYLFRNKSEGVILLNKTTYADLYAVVGDEYTPSGTDSTLFGVPYSDCDNGKMLLAY